jgi:hypothetical protein
VEVVYKLHRPWSDPDLIVFEFVRELDSLGGLVCGNGFSDLWDGEAARGWARILQVSYVYFQVYDFSSGRRVLRRVRHVDICGLLTVGGVSGLCRTPLKGAVGHWGWCGLVSPGRFWGGALVFFLAEIVLDGSFACVCFISCVCAGFIRSYLHFFVFVGPGRGP